MLLCLSNLAADNNIYYETTLMSLPLQYLLSKWQWYDIVKWLKYTELATEGLHQIEIMECIVLQTKKSSHTLY